MTDFFRRHTGLLQLVFVIGIVGGAILVSASMRPEQGAVRPASAPDDVTVTVVNPAPAEYSPTLTLNGVVEARTSTNIIPQVAGRVVEVSPLFRPGASLSEGDMLFVVDPADYELAVARTLAEIEAARSELALLEAEAAAERQVWEGQFPDRKIPDLIARVPQIAAAKARIHSAEAARDAAVLDLSRTTVRAPFDARVLETRLDIGQVVGGGAAVGTVFALDSLEIAVPVSTAELARIGPPTGRGVSIVSDVSDGLAYDGAVVRTAAALDERTRLGTLYVQTDNAAQLTVGEFVTVEIEGAATTAAYRVPAAALTSRDELWVVEADRLASRDVRILGFEGDAAIVASFDLADGVVALPPADVRDGLPVEIDLPTRYATAGGAISAAD